MHNNSVNRILRTCHIVKRRIFCYKHCTKIEELKLQRQQWQQELQLQQIQQQSRLLELSLEEKQESSNGDFLFTLEFINELILEFKSDEKDSLTFEAYF